MQYTRLGKSDLLVSRICMGCMGFGDPSTGQHSWTLDETASRDIIRYGLEKGINFYDTAIAYQNGSSERYVGRALREMAKLKRYIPLLLLAKYELLVFQTAMPGSWRRRTPLLNAKG